MGRLDLTIHSLDLYQPAFSWREDAVVNPRVNITVDDTYHFQTKVKRNTMSASYEEKFTVGNTHRLAVIEILVYGVSESSGFALLREEKHNEERLIARTFIAIGRLVQGQTKTRQYYLSTIPRESEGNVFATAPRGVAGTITVSLWSEKLGEPSSLLRLDSTAEQQYVERIKRLFLSCAPEDVAMIDPIISQCRDSKELLRGGGGQSATSATRATNASRVNQSPHGSSPATTAGQSASTALEPVSLGTRTTLPVCEANLNLQPLQYHRPTTAESFEDTIRRLCQQYRTAEPVTRRLRVRLLGLTNLDKKALNTSLLGSDTVITVLRTSSQVYVARHETLNETVVYSDDTTVEFDVVDPEHFFVHILVLGKNGSDWYEIGRCNVSVAPLAMNHLSPRHMFLTRGDALYTALAFPAVVHLILEPLDFGLTSVEDVTYVDTFYDRLSRFFRRYDPVRVPSVDLLICARLPNLEGFMNDLVVQHGREPGTVRLDLTLCSVTALRESADVEAHRREVMAVVTMGHSTITSATRTVRRFAACTFDECYTFDVVRETDMLRVEIVKANCPDVVYGRVEFTCLNTQRGVANDRRLWLVGAAGTPDAYFSGIVTISMLSQEIGHPYQVDVEYENMMAGRLRRYAFRRIPETIHRVNLAVATVFDMETFMAQLAARYGEEDPTYVIYFTITGCRRLRSRFGGINPYVVARVGVATYETKWVKNNTEPDFFEFCEFRYDRPGDNAITLVVMDHSDIGEDREIGHAVIPLVNTQVNTQYNDFVSLLSPIPKLKQKDIGAVGFKYTVFDTNLVDHTRTRLMQQEARRMSKSNLACPWIEGERRTHALHAEEGEPGQVSGSVPFRRTLSTDSEGGLSRASTGADGLNATTSSKRRETLRPFRWIGGAWGAMRNGFRSQSAGATTGREAGGASPEQHSRARRQRSRHTDATSGVVSPETLSRLPSALSASSLNSDLSGVARADRRSASAHSTRSHTRLKRFPTQNLMDGGILSVGEFCGHDSGDSRLPSARTSNDFLTDLGESGSQHSSGLLEREGSNASAGSFPSTPTGSLGTQGSTDERVGLTPHLTSANPRRGAGGGPLTVHFAESPVRGDKSRRIRVRVLCCRNLPNQSSQMPNPYLLLSTNRDSRRTHVEFATLHPQFQCEYVMHVDDPYQDSLSLTVLSDTPFGSRKLGHCVLSLVNVQRGEFRTRWASLVMHSHEHDAVQRGSVCVSLRGENFGLDLIPAADAENRLRERIRSYLVSEHPEQLHLLEWFVGEYTRKEGTILRSALQRPSRFLWGGLRNSAPPASGNLRTNLTRQLDSAFGHRSRASKADAKEQEATIQITVHDVTHLYVDDFLATGSCQVKIALEERGRKASKRTRSVLGTEGDFSIEEDVTMVLKHPSAATSMRLSVVFDGRHRAGMCFASLSDLHRGVSQKRQYMLVVGPNTSAPLITGYLTVSILSTEFGSGEAAPTEDDEQRFCRLQQFFAYYLPREVATTALTYAATFNVDAYLRKLVEQHGPEPGEHRLRVTVDRCTDVHLTPALAEEIGRSNSSSSSSRAASRLSPFCIIRCGLQEFHSGVVRGSTEFVFLESFDVKIGLPDRDLLEFILMVHLPSQDRSEEVGRAAIPLDELIRDESNRLQLPIVRNPGTQHAEIMGNASLVLFTADFGQDTHLREAAMTQAVFVVDASPSTATASTANFIKGEPAPTGFHPRTASQSANGVATRRQTLTRPGAHANNRHVPDHGSPPPLSPTAPYVMFDATHAMVKGSPGRTVARGPARLGGDTHSRTSTGAGGTGSFGSPTGSNVRTDAGVDRSLSAQSTPPPQGHHRQQRQNPSVRLAILGISFANNDVKPSRDMYLRVSLGSNILFRTKLMSADELSTLQDGQFELQDTSEINYVMLTLKIGINQVMGKGVLCYADFTLARCVPCRQEIRRLRLYHADTNQFLGICRFQITVPDVKVVNPEPPIAPGAVEPLLDDLASLFATYSRKDLRRLTYVLFRSSDEERLHALLRQQLAPSVLATFYLAIQKVELVGPLKNNCLVEVTVGQYTARVMRQQSAVKGILEYGMSNPEAQKLEFPLARVDVGAPGDCTDALRMRLCVYDTNKPEKVPKRTPVGSVVLSIRALLSPQLYDMSEPVTVSLVAVDRGTNRAHASLAGSITFRLFPPAFEVFPRAVRFPSSALQTVSRSYVRYYLARIDRFLRHYDPNSLETLHAQLYDQFIENGKWETALPKMLNDLVSRWGPEKTRAEDPPELEPRNKRMLTTLSRSDLVKMDSRAELTPAFGRKPGQHQ